MAKHRSSRHGLMLGCSLYALAAGLHSAAAQNMPTPSPSIYGLSAADFQQWDAYKRNYVLSTINASTAYARGFTGYGVTVAIIDTGLDATHPAFIGRVSDLSYNFIDNAAKPIFDAGTGHGMGHGTAVASSLAANPWNNSQVMGVAFDSTIMSLFGIAQADKAISYAANNGARVLNGSYGYTFEYDYSFQTYNVNRIESSYAAASLAASKDVLMIFSAGNNHSEDNGDNYRNASSNSLLPYISPKNNDGSVYRVYNSSSQRVDGQLDFSSLNGFIVAAVALKKDGSIADYSNLCGVAAAWCIAAPADDINVAFPRDKPNNNGE